MRAQTTEQLTAAGIGGEPPTDAALSQAITNLHDLLLAMPRPVAIEAAFQAIALSASLPIHAITNMTIIVLGQPSPTASQSASTLPVPDSAVPSTALLLEHILGVVGGCAVLALAIFLAIICMRRAKRRASNEHVAHMTGTTAQAAVRGLEEAANTRGSVSTVGAAAEAQPVATTDVAVSVEPHDVTT